MILQILNNIYISDINESLEKHIYNKHNINIVINCTKNTKFINLDNIKKVRVPLSFDMNNTDINLLNKNINKILGYIKTNFIDNVILITCYDGIRISPLIVSLFILKYTKMDKKELLYLLKTKSKNIVLDYDLNIFDI